MSQTLDELLPQNLDDSVLSLDDLVLSLDDLVLSLDDSESDVHELVAMGNEDGTIMGNERENWLSPNFLQRIPRTINLGQVPSTQTDFPLVINNTFPELIGHAEDELRFASTDDIQLDYEIEKFDTITGELIVWIKKSTVSVDDIIYIYFDNTSPSNEQDSAAVFSNNFIVVQHMNQLSGNILDSTANHNDGIPFGSPTNATGLIGNGKNLSATNEGYFTLDNPTLHTSDITVSALINLPVTNLVHIIASKNFNPSNTDWTFLIGFGSLTVFLSSGNFINGAVSAGVPHHVAFVISGGTTLKMYVDKVLTFTQTITPKVTSSTSRLQIGDTAVSSTGGVVDEVHITNDGKSDDWIATESNNQLDDDAFWTTGAVEAIPPLVAMGYELE